MRRMAWVFLVLIAFTFFLHHSTTAQAAPQDLAEKQLPALLILTEPQTLLYDAPDGKQIGSAALQVANVLEAEEGWRGYFIQESQPLIWYKIETEEGQFWIRPKQPEYTGDFYEWIRTSAEEFLYDEPSEQGKSANTISPQPLRTIGTYNGYYRIQTWLGYKWIKPVHELLPYYIPTDEWVSVNETMPIFDAPEGDAAISGYLSPGQSVVAFERINYDWFHIRTWLGDKWISHDYFLPKDLQTGEKAVELKDNTPVYAFPNRDAQVLGTLSPQIVMSFERGSGWYHIRSSWLGDVWIYASPSAADPEKYVPPVVVADQPIAGTWSFIQIDPHSNAPRDYPLSPSILQAPNARSITPFGEPVSLQFSLANASDDPITIAKDEQVTIEIERITGSYFNRTYEKVWSGTLPVSQAFKTKMWTAQALMEWDGKDSDGKPVPFGEYTARVKLPWTIHYSIDGKDEALLQKVRDSIFTKCYFSIGAP
ncbi:hypothetical protein [Paenibacillus mesotrionivorans]|uniref:Uncharacterized protein n=1 Tax=Paenibacillus mesotrionivorans TaxID=3160968 RepID=A0ACC7P3A5_9BACL